MVVDELKALQLQLHYAARGDLVVPRTALQLGNRAFCVAGPVAWNTYIINVHKHAQDTSVLSFLLPWLKAKFH